MSSSCSVGMVAEMWFKCSSADVFVKMTSSLFHTPLFQAVVK